MISLTIDTTKFDKTFKEYMKYTSRSLTEACNQHAYYIARNAVNVTKGADKRVIRAKLEGPSARYPDVPLAAILVNVERKKKGRKGLSGTKMANAVSKLIRKYQSHVNFVRSGWIPAVKQLATIVPKKNGARIPAGTDVANRNFGGSRAAVNGFSPAAWIWNSIVGGKQFSPEVHKIILAGAVKAVEQERISMLKYIKRKQDEITKKLFG